MKRLAGPPSKAQMCVTSLRLGVASAAKSALAETVVATYTSTAPQRCAAPCCPHAPAMFVLTALVVLLAALTPAHVARARPRRLAASDLCRGSDGRARGRHRSDAGFERVCIARRLPTPSFSTARSKTAARCGQLAARGATVVLVLGPGSAQASSPRCWAGRRARRPDRSPPALGLSARSDHPCRRQYPVEQRAPGARAARRRRQRPRPAGHLVRDAASSFSAGAAVGHGRASTSSRRFSQPDANQPVTRLGLLQLPGLCTGQRRRVPCPSPTTAAHPCPSAAERTVILGLLLAIMRRPSCAFSFVRRYSLRHPEALDSLVADRERYQQRQEGTGWEEIGFHRPLGGFLLAVMFGLMLFRPADHLPEPDPAHRTSCPRRRRSASGAA